MNEVKKYLLLFIGLIFVTIGMIGIFVPGLPTTIFMILAAYCFLRSSDKLYNWVINNKFVGDKVKHFIETKTIPLRGKIHSISAMWLMVIISIFLLKVSLVVKVIIAIAAIVGTLVILSYPTAKDV
ncbi:MAG: YbaN family protein [Ignavibacteria bacterium]|nr:YbaN family protein [Ignavibacteria bacterium]